jgi:4-amino-4-deoxychorismate lyase
MASEPVVVVTLDGQAHPQRPVLYADDLAVAAYLLSRLWRGGGPCLLEAHLTVDQIGGLMDLPSSDLPRWRAVVAIAGAGAGRTGAARRSAAADLQPRRESGSHPDGIRQDVRRPGRVAEARRDGVAALTLARGLPADGAGDMPWLLACAKTLSYAVNMAALRHAERHGAGDVVFVSSEGYVLEGPRSTVVIATEIDGRLGLLTPPPWYPILRGTTQQALFEVARNKGYDCDYRALQPADLVAAQGVWLVSSITLAARVHTLDGKPLRNSPLAAELSELVDAAIVSDR